MSAYIFGIIFDEYPFLNSLANFSYLDQALWSGHLSHCMWQKQQFMLRRYTYSRDNVHSLPLRTILA